jgi:predicted peptidase
MISSAFILGFFLMTEPREAIAIQPGKQLPQSLTVRVNEHASAPTDVMHYLLFTPTDYKGDGERWPLLLFLHGLGESGKNQLDRVKTHGPPKLVETRPDFPFVVVSPQCPMPKGGMKDVPNAWKAEQLIQLVDHVVENLHIDRDRVYVTGLSMGGFGTWRLVSKYPDRFAAALPICGGGKPETMAEKLTRVPIWAFHGARDEVVPLAKSQEMVDAVRAAGGDVQFTVYPDVEHDSWTATYNNQEVYDWLLSHRRPVN